ncbi:MAG TPA: restriction endonuclease [Thermoanaerobaculia bacterium]|nr:restriction endonuclease [Thermoanaerobaculia bacterium]
MSEPEWRKFEALTSRIQAELAPDAAVTLDEKLVGRSGVAHQCDVVVRSKVGQLPFVCVIECKDYSEPVGLDPVRSFAARLQDLQVNQGVVVAARGFTTDAKQFARSQRILTYTLVDAETVKWSDQALLPVLMIRTDFNAATIHLFDAADGTEIDLGTDPEQSILVEVRHTRRQEVVPLYALMQYTWDDILEKKQIPRPDANFDTEPGEYVLNDQSNRPVIIRFRFDPLERFSVSHVRIAFGRGFREEQSGRFISPGYQSAVVDLHAALTEWPEVTDPAKLPIRPVATLFALGYLTRAGNSPRHVVFGWRQAPPNSALHRT